MGVLRPQVSGELVIITKLAYDTVGSNETGVKSINEHMFTRPVFLILSSLHLPISPPHLPDPDPSHCVPNWENWEVCVCGAEGVVVGIKVRWRGREMQRKSYFGTGS